MRQAVDVEYIDMYNIDPENFWVALEHMGRYAYAAWFVGKRKYKTVLDIGCSNGFGCEKLADCAAHVTGVDINAELIEEAKSRLGDKEKIDYHVLDIDKRDWKNTLSGKSFDVITCFEALEHIEYPEKLLLSLKALIKPNGRLLLSVPAGEYEPLDENGKSVNPYHRHVFLEEKCTSLFRQAGFVVERVLGQSALNLLMRKHNTFCSRNPRLAPFAASSFKITPQTIEYFIQMFAYPEKDDMENSYSRLYVLKPSK